MQWVLRWAFGVAVAVSGTGTVAFAQEPAPPTARFEDPPAPSAEPVRAARAASKARPAPERRGASDAHGAPVAAELPPSGLDPWRARQADGAESTSVAEAAPGEWPRASKGGVNPVTQDPVLVNPWAHFDVVPPQVDELLIVNPYGTGGPRLRPRGRAEPAEPARDTSQRAFISPKDFEGEVYVNGVQLGSADRVTVLPGEHNVTVVPAGGVPVTVWVEVSGGQERRFRFVEGSVPVAKTDAAER